MPLNLLQHKSWHVGSAKNQERVRRDEREAALKEEEEERRMQLADAERRLQILQQRLKQGKTGEDVSLQLDHDEVATFVVKDTAQTTEWGRREKTKKRRREDDDEIPPPKLAEVPTMKYSSSDAPLIGTDGHINLFPPEAAPQKSVGNKDYMADKRRKEEELEAQYTMKLSRPSDPWYSTADGVAEVDRAKDENARRREERVETRAREENDPMNLMKRGVEKLREVRDGAAVERRKRDAEVGIGLSREVEGLSRRDHRHRHRYKSRSRSRSREYRGSNRRSRSKEGHNHRSDRDRKHRGEGENRHRNSRRSRSPRRERNNHRRENEDRRENEASGSKEKDRNDDKDSVMAKLREEKAAREAAERQKVRALVEDEMAFRKPDKWTASTAGGRGKYSRQFGE
ncbi:hypothetical protein TWF694_004789 [Orbilia ellipsospora]|uniref:CBF1-interacting co-repressor CIR N-terminal domain-containing protein n=1 Tax=Orbilia ellipsospora TaxID=2528407 RepID=A0AAV9WW58_9PEZI